MDKNNEKLNFETYQGACKVTAIYGASISNLVDTVDLHEGDVAGYQTLQKIKGLMRLSYVGLGMGEVGELQGKIKKVIRDSGGIINQETIDKLAGELGDVLWYVAQMCTELGISMELVADHNLSKLSGRKERGTLGGSGDER